MRAVFGIVLLAIVVLLGGPFAYAETAPKRVALVIGNSAYAHVPALANPGNDARLLAKTLAAAGFEVIGSGAQLNLSGNAMRDAIRSFGRRLGENTVAVFYYSGHGAEFHGENYLIPVDADPQGAADVDFELVSVDLLLRQIGAAGNGMSIVILDACRTNPFGKGLRDVGVGLAQMQAPRGTLVSYATQPGKAALDGSGGNSPFALALVEVIRQPGLDVFNTFNQVALRVDAATNHAQQPWMATSPIAGQFFFTAPGAVSNPTHTPAAAPQIAVAAPQRVATSPELSADEASAKGKVAFNAQDYAEAMRWFRLAADKGLPSAMIHVGSFYAGGWGVTKDCNAARNWFEKAAAAGNDVAKSRLTSDPDCSWN